MCAQPGRVPGRAIHASLGNDIPLKCSRAASVGSRMRLVRCARCTCVRSQQQGGAQWCTAGQRAGEGGAHAPAQNNPVYLGNDGI